MRSFLSLIFCLLLGASAFGQYTSKKAAEFSATDISGKNYSLNDFKGKVVLMTFWSTRCQICRSEIPEMNCLADKYRGKEVVFLGMTVENETKVQPYLQKNPFNFRITPNSFGIMMMYADRDRDGNLNMGFPAYFLLDKKGEIDFKGSGWDKTGTIDSHISTLLGSR